MMVGSLDVEEMGRFGSSSKPFLDCGASCAQNDFMPADKLAILTDQGDIGQVVVFIEIFES